MMRLYLRNTHKRISSSLLQNLTSATYNSMLFSRMEKGIERITGRKSIACEDVSAHSVAKPLPKVRKMSGRANWDFCLVCAGCVLQSAWRPLLWTPRVVASDYNHRQWVFQGCPTDINQQYLVKKKRSGRHYLKIRITGGRKRWKFKGKNDKQ